MQLARLTVIVLSMALLFGEASHWARAEVVASDFAVAGGFPPIANLGATTTFTVTVGVGGMDQSSEGGLELTLTAPLDVLLFTRVLSISGDAPPAGCGLGQPSGSSFRTVTCSYPQKVLEGQVSRVLVEAVAATTGVSAIGQIECLARDLGSDQPPAACRNTIAGTTVIDELPPTVSGEVTRLVADGVRPSASADGSIVAYTQGPNVYVFTGPEQPPRLVSLGLDGRPADGYSDNAKVSRDGRFVAFESTATNLVSQVSSCVSQPWTCSDVFVYELSTGEVTRVSVTSTGQPGSGRSTDAAISGDGSLVVFSSTATNLGMRPGYSALFSHDRRTGETSLVSKDTAGEPIFYVFSPSLSADGSILAYTSSSRIGFVTDLRTGVTELLGGSEPSISADGRYLSYVEAGGPLVGGPDNVKLLDRFTGQVSALTNFYCIVTPCLGGGSYSPSISDDGRFVAFGKSGFGTIYRDVYIFDRATGVSTLVSHDAAGNPGNSWSDNASVSGDGNVVVFASQASNLPDGSPHLVSKLFSWRRNMAPRPTCVASSIAVQQGTPLTFTAPCTPTPAEAAAAGYTYSLLIGGLADTRGTIRSLEDGQLEYTPPPGESGLDSFLVSLTICRGIECASSDSARISVTVESRGHTLTGSVRRPNREPVAGVEVYASGNSATTDMKGEYVIEGLSPGVHIVGAQKSGFTFVGPGTADLSAGDGVVDLVAKPRRVVIVLAGVDSAGSCQDGTTDQADQMVNVIRAAVMTRQSAINPIFGAEDFLQFSYGDPTACQNGFAQASYTAGDTCAGVGSAATKIDQMLLALGPDTEVDLVGHSLGGVVAAFWAATAPRATLESRVHSVVTLDSPLTGRFVRNVLLHWYLDSECGATSATGRDLAAKTAVIPTIMDLGRSTAREHFSGVVCTPAGEVLAGYWRNFSRDRLTGDHTCGFTQPGVVAQLADSLLTNVVDTDVLEPGRALTPGITYTGAWSALGDANWMDTFGLSTVRRRIELGGSGAALDVDVFARDIRLLFVDTSRLGLPSPSPNVRVLVDDVVAFDGAVTCRASLRCSVAVAEALPLGWHVVRVEVRGGGRLARVGFDGIELRE